MCDEQRDCSKSTSQLVMFVSKVIRHILLGFCPCHIIDGGVCLQHEELVLLLIQLRRSQSRLRDAKSYCRSQLDDTRDNEKGYQFR